MIDDYVKLTLRLDKAVIRQAKEYARKHNRSISKLVENYLRFITGPANREDVTDTPITNQLAGILKGKAELDSEHYAEYLIEKYK